MKTNTIRLEEEDEEQKKSSALDQKIDLLLLEKRRVFLSSAVSDESAQDVIKKFWYLEITNPGKPILFVINSPGGSVDAGFAIWDQIKMLTSPVTTLVTGLAASFGSILSLAASPGKRFATPNARIMIHQPLVSGVIRGQATDLEIHAKEIIKARDSLIELYAKSTGQDIKTIGDALDRDTWLSADEAKDFGLLDGITSSYKELGF